ncbi:hypothetical protein PRUB_a0348 [Pseudoalteromonas rubra]|uniref:Uncharacterized protein n=1 Tax=Pseudoalteromonas rubra TaxID=43658 RepID=A0A8T0C7H2_9GAMM|nr:hypothetical protein PRUB_a0348 [Pseudoalteromonas rubra]
MLEVFQAEPQGMKKLASNAYLVALRLYLVKAQSKDLWMLMFLTRHHWVPV